MSTNKRIDEALSDRQSGIAEKIKAAVERSNALGKSIDEKRKDPHKHDIKALLEKDKQKLDELKRDPRMSAIASETVTTSSHLLLVPQIIMGDVIEAEEAHTVAARYFTPVRLDPSKDTVHVVYPFIGSMRAGIVGEGGEYPVATLDVGRASSRDIMVRKVGLQINFTEEAIEGSAWDLISIYASEAGKALARFKEYWAFKEFVTYGHTVFDNDSTDANAWTTGRNQVGTLNNTLSFEDMMDVFKALYLNGASLTDLLVHPLMWFAWQQTNIYGGFSYNNPGTDASKDTMPWAFDIANNIPHKPQLVVAPELPFDYRTFKTDLYALDASMVGVNVIKEDLTTAEFDDPYKDIRHYKLRERYALGVVNEGRGIAVARNIVADPSWPYKILLTNEV